MSTLANACSEYANVAIADVVMDDYKDEDQFVAVEFDGDSREEHLRLARKYNVSITEAYNALEAALRNAWQNAAR